MPSVVPSRCARASVVERRRPQRDERLAARASRPTTPSAVPVDREQQALREQLAEHAPAPGAERGANRQLALPARRSRHEQMRNVRARDEQHQPHRVRQHHERIAEAAGAATGGIDHGLKRDSAARDRRRARVQRVELARAPLRRRRPGAAPDDHHAPTLSSRRSSGSHTSSRGLADARPLQRRGQHADDRVRANRRA